MADFDYIIVGAGSAGCVLAQPADRGSAQQGAAAGGRTEGQFHVDQHPGRLHQAAEQPALQLELRHRAGGQRARAARIPIPRGRTLGGSSSINGMLYVRGNPLDYNTWAQFGNRGWSYESVLPYFRKAEHFEPGGDATRGRGGPLNVAHMIERAELLDAFIDAAVAEGFPRNPDYNNGQQEGFGYYQVTQKNGDRWSTARGFLDPARGRPNLRIETEAYTTRIILEGKRAVGVAYTPGRTDAPGAVQRRGDRRGGRGEVAAPAGTVRASASRNCWVHSASTVQSRAAGRRRELPRPFRAADELAGEAAGDAERADARPGLRQGDRQVLHPAAAAC